MHSPRTIYFMQVAAATGDYRVEIRLDQYQNPFHLRADGTCCNVRRQHCTSCRNRFTFCILQFDDLSGYESSSLCGSQPHYATGVVRGGASVFAHNLDNLSFAEKGYIDKQSHICNPLVFTGNGSWPVSQYVCAISFVQHVLVANLLRGALYILSFTKFMVIITKSCQFRMSK